MNEVRTEAGVILPTSAVVQSVESGGDGMRRGTIGWKFVYEVVPPPDYMKNRMVKILQSEEEP